MPSSITRVVTVRLPLDWYAEIVDAVSRPNVATPYAGDLPQDTGVSEWIRRAIREVLNKGARSASSRQRAAERALADQPVIPYVPPLPIADGPDVRWGRDR